MTRETKLGVVVAGAFVSLLTVVVVNRLQETAPTEAPPAPQVVHADSGKAFEKETDRSVKPPQSDVIPAAHSQVQPPNPLPDVIAPPVSALKTVEAPKTVTVSPPPFQPSSPQPVAVRNDNNPNPSGATVTGPPMSVGSDVSRMDVQPHTPLATPPGTTPLTPVGEQPKLTIPAAQPLPTQPANRTEPSVEFKLSPVGVSGTNPTAPNAQQAQSQPGSAQIRDGNKEPGTANGIQPVGAQNKEPAPVVPSASPVVGIGPIPPAPPPAVGASPALVPPTPTPVTNSAKDDEEKMKLLREQKAQADLKMQSRIELEKKPETPTTAPLAPVGPPITVGTAPVTPATVGPTPPPVPPPSGLTGVSPTSPTTVVDRKDNLNGVAPAPVTPVVPAPVVGEKPAATLPPISVPAVAPVEGPKPGDLPAVGTPAPVSVAPLSVTPPAAPQQPVRVGLQPIVSVVDVEESRPEDKSFADLSNRYYHNEKYDKALLAFNLADSRADPRIKQSPLQPGVKVQVPSLSKLEELYPHLIPGMKPAPAAPVTPPVPSESKAAPPAVAAPKMPETYIGLQKTPTPVPPATQPVTPVGGTAPMEGSRSYQVPGQGEMVYNIARQTLGNGDRWPEIVRLNPQVFSAANSTAYPIPGGTVLRLP
jgi:hypothetical protein